MFRALAIALSLTFGTALMTGCDEELSREEDIKVKNDGTVVREKEVVKEQPDGTIVKEKSKDVTKPRD